MYSYGLWTVWSIGYRAWLAILTFRVLVAVTEKTPQETGQHIHAPWPISIVCLLLNVMFYPDLPKIDNGPVQVQSRTKSFFSNSTV